MRRIRWRNEGRDLAVLDAADPDALLEARIGLVVGLRIRHVDHVVLVDDTLLGRPNCFHSASSRRPGRKIWMRLLTRSATNSRFWESSAMLCGVLSSPAAAPCLPQAVMNFPSFAELHDAVVGDRLVTRRDRRRRRCRRWAGEDVARAVEDTSGLAGNAGLAERHQHLAVGRELDRGRRPCRCRRDLSPPRHCPSRST